MKKSWIICISIFLILTAGVIGGSKFFFDWMRVEIIKLQTSEAEYPWINQKPLKLELERKQSFANVIEAMEISLCVPWEDMKLTEAENNLCTFQSENFRIIVSKESDLPIQDFIKDMIGPRKALHFDSYLTQIYEKKVICSQYEFDKTILNATHEELKEVHSNKKLDMLYMLLILKGQFIPESAQTGIFYFKNDLVKGFQFGNKSSIVLWVYNAKNEKYRIDIVRIAYPNTKILKSVLEEVRRIIPTIKIIN